MAHISSSALRQAIHDACRPGEGAPLNLPTALAPLMTQLDDLRQGGEAARALPLYEEAIGACALLAPTTADAGAHLMGTLRGLFRGWLLSRQALERPAEGTLDALQAWQESELGHLTGPLTRQLIPDLDEAGLDALQDRASAQLAGAPPLPYGTPRPLRIGPEWLAAEILLDLHHRRRDPDAYSALCQRLGATSDDCARLGEMYRDLGDLRSALRWVEEGLTLADSTLSASSPTRGRLKTMRWDLYVAQGRISEAVEMIWADFQRQPSVDLYAALMQIAPEPDRALWRRRALERSRRAGLLPFIDVALYAEALAPLASAVVEAGPDLIARLSHHATEPVAVALEATHPSAAALIYRALALRILDADRSAYYAAAVDHLRDARRCYLAADQAGVWAALVDYIRRAHGQKHPFMARFKAVIHGADSGPTPPFLDQARAEWSRLTRS